MTRTCGTCAHCARHGGSDDAPLYDPFYFVTDEATRADLRRRVGICVEEQDDPVAVMLDTTPKDMPCCGDFWAAREQEEDE